MYRMNAVQDEIEIISPAQPSVDHDDAHPSPSARPSEDEGAPPCSVPETGPGADVGLCGWGSLADDGEGEDDGLCGWGNLESEILRDGGEENGGVGVMCFGAAGGTNAARITSPMKVSITASTLAAMAQGRRGGAPGANNSSPGMSSPVRGMMSYVVCEIKTCYGNAELVGTGCLCPGRGGCCELYVTASGEEISTSYGRRCQREFRGDHVNDLGGVGGEVPT